VLATDAVARTVEVRPSGAHRTGVRKTMITEEDRPKPPELLDLYTAIPEVFSTLKEEFQVPDTYELVLHDDDDTKADALTTFKNRVVLAARHAGGDGGVARLR
jgi:hypothetical protein